MAVMKLISFLKHQRLVPTIADMAASPCSEGDFDNTCNAGANGVDVVSSSESETDSMKKSAKHEARKGSREGQIGWSYGGKGGSPAVITGIGVFRGKIDGAGWLGSKVVAKAVLAA